MDISWLMKISWRSCEDWTTTRTEDLVSQKQVRRCSVLKGSRDLDHMECGIELGVSATVHLDHSEKWVPRLFEPEGQSPVRNGTTLPSVSKQPDLTALIIPRSATRPQDWIDPSTLPLVLATTTSKSEIELLRGVFTSHTLWTLLLALEESKLLAFYPARPYVSTMSEISQLLWSNRLTSTSS